MIPCYVSGKRMHATETTWDFIGTVVRFLEDSGLGYDTRYRYYRELLPDMPSERLLQKIHEPIEFFDPEWPSYWSNKRQGRDKDAVLTEFMMQHDVRFRRNAAAAIFCYDEAGFGSGISTMRFIIDQKPVLGLFNPDVKKRGVNIHNFLQLELEYPTLVTLVEYRTLQQIPGVVEHWLGKLSVRQ